MAGARMTQISLAFKLRTPLARVALPILRVIGIMAIMVTMPRFLDG